MEQWWMPEDKYIKNLMIHNKAFEKQYFNMPDPVIKVETPKGVRMVETFLINGVPFDVDIMDCQLFDKLLFKSRYREIANIIKNPKIIKSHIPVIHTDSIFNICSALKLYQVQKSVFVHCNYVTYDLHADKFTNLIDDIKSMNHEVRVYESFMDIMKNFYSWTDLNYTQEIIIPLLEQQFTDKGYLKRYDARILDAIDDAYKQNMEKPYGSYPSSRKEPDAFVAGFDPADPDGDVTILRRTNKFGKDVYEIVFTHEEQKSLQIPDKLMIIGCTFQDIRMACMDLGVSHKDRRLKLIVSDRDARGLNHSQYDLVLATSKAMDNPEFDDIILSLYRNDEPSYKVMQERKLYKTISTGRNKGKTLNMAGVMESVRELGLDKPASSLYEEDLKYAREKLLNTMGLPESMIGETQKAILHQMDKLEQERKEMEFKLFIENGSLPSSFI